MNIELPRSAYRGLVCICCGSGTSNRLLKCARCARVTYCNTSCQKKDYPDHKRFCRAWAAVRGAETHVTGIAELSHEDLEEFTERRTKWLVGELESLIGRPLKKVEQCLVIFEPRCAICFRTVDDINDRPDYPGQELMCCARCSAVYVCSEEHGDILRETHTSLPYEPGGPVTRCKMHQLVVLDDKENSQYCRVEAKPIWFPSRRLEKHASLMTFSCPDSWVRWFSLPTTQWPEDHINLLDMRSASAPLSFPMTVAYGMELYDDPKCRALLEKGPGSSAQSIAGIPFRDRSRLEIHIIGVRANDLVTKQALVFEELHHLLPRCKELILRFIAPDLVNYPALFSEVPLDIDEMTYGCDECRASGVIRTQSMHAYMYHDWAQERRRNNGPFDKWAIPDLVVCFNAAMTESSANSGCWAPIVSLLLDMDIPTLVSAFTEKDAKSDRRFLANLGARVIIEPRKNPWRNEQALPEFCGNDEFYFFNHHVLGLCGRE